MLLFRIVDKSFFSEPKTLKINSDSLIVIKDNSKFQILYSDIEEVALYTKKNKSYLKIIYSGGNKRIKKAFTIGNVQSPQIVMNTIADQIKRDKSVFSAIKISF